MTQKTYSPFIGRPAVEFFVGVEYLMTLANLECVESLIPLSLQDECNFYQFRTKFLERIDKTACEVDPTLSSS